jgi:hypothetical protein
MSKREGATMSNLLGHINETEIRKAIQRKEDAILKMEHHKEMLKRATNEMMDAQLELNWLGYDEE